jgi:hypothetical protein
LDVDFNFDFLGMDKFRNVSVLGFTLPGNDDKHSGILLSLISEFFNPSFGAMQVGTASFDFTFQVSQRRLRKQRATKEEYGRDSEGRRQRGGGRVEGPIEREEERSKRRTKGGGKGVEGGVPKENESSRKRRR